MSHRWRDYRGAIICILLFAVVSVLVESGTTSDFDRRLLVAIAAARTPARTAVMLFITNVGSWKGGIPMVAAVAGFLRYRHRSADALRYVAVGVSGEALYAICKLIFHRPRPTVVSHLDLAGWTSYPSGHAMLAPILFGYGLYLVGAALPNRDLGWIIWPLAVLVPLLIAVSRLYVGVHYPTDVGGGLCLGVGWVLLWRDRRPTITHAATT